MSLFHLCLIIISQKLKRLPKMVASGQRLDLYMQPVAGDHKRTKQISLIQTHWRDWFNLDSKSAGIASTLSLEQIYAKVVLK